MKATKEFYEYLRKEVMTVNYDIQVPDNPPGTQYSETLLKDVMIKDLEKRLTKYDADISEATDENAKLKMKLVDLRIELDESKKRLEDERMAMYQEADRMKAELYARAQDLATRQRAFDEEVRKFKGKGNVIAVSQNLERPNPEFIPLDTIIDYAKRRADLDRAEPFINMLNSIFRGVDNKDIFKKIDSVETHFQEEAVKRQQPVVKIEQNYGPLEGDIKEQKNILGQANDKLLK